MVVFVLNALAFVLIGMQLRPILERLGQRGSGRKHGDCRGGAADGHCRRALPG
ncbi:MAG: hypothetical protein QM702_11200 [Rubrivivax sp.]